MDRSSNRDRQRELLAASTRTARELEEDDLIEIGGVRYAPGKLTANDVGDQPRASWERTAPGKLTLADVQREQLSPYQALDYASSIQRVDRRAEPSAADLDDHGALATAFSFLDGARGGFPLPADLATRLTRELAVDISELRLHTDDRAARAAAALGARAFTIGQDIYFAAGAYDPTSADGIELIAHEAAHAAENATGRAPAGGRRVSRPDDSHERHADDFARRFAARNRQPITASDPADLVEKVRREGRRMNIPHLAEIEEELGAPLDFVEAYTGEAAQIACQLMSAGAFAVRNIVAFADPSPQRETLLHELTHIVQMGGRVAAAPRELLSGSLRIGAREAAAEHEAKAVVSGGASRIAVSADPDVIHREDPPAGSTTTPWEPEAAKERFKKWLKDHVAKNDEGKPTFGPATDDEYRYPTSSKTHFERSDYTATAFVGVTGLSKSVMDDELAKLWRDHAKELGLCKLGASSKFAWVEPSDEQWANSVEYLPDRTRRKSSVTEKWKVYLEILDKPTIKKHKIQPEPVILKKNAKYAFDRTVDFTADGAKPFTDGELGKCRDSYEDAFVKVEAWHWGKGGKPYWTSFFDDVIKPEGGAIFAGGYAQIQGTIFGRIATEDINKVHQNAVTRGEHFFADDDFKKNPTKTIAADGISVVGKTIKAPAVIDFKSGAETPDTDMLNAAHDYNLIITKPVPKYKVDGVEQEMKFEHVLYVFTTKDVAESWAPKLKKMVPGAGHLQIVPKVDDESIGTIDMTMNPTFQVPLESKTARTHRIAAPPIMHPGINFREVRVNTKAAGSTEVTGGTVLLDVDMGGAMKKEGIRKELTPDVGNRAKVENKLPDLKGELSKILKGADVDAKVTDDGVEGTLTVKPGTKIGVLQVTDATVKVTYGASAGLAVSGDVGLSYKGGKVTGKLAVGWASGAWTFSGTVDFPAGMVEGLSAVTANLSYGAGKWILGVDYIEYTRKFNAITLTGKALGVKFDVDKGHFSGLMQLEADLGMFGKASASAELEKNELKKAEISYDSPEFKYPAKQDPPAFKGTIGGTLTYENERFHGKIRGTANVNVPGLKAIAGESGVGLAIDAHINADGSYGGTVRTTEALQFGKHLRIPSIAATIEDDGSMSGSFSVEVVKIKFLEKASIKCKVTKEGVEIEDVSLEVPFDYQGKFWGKLTLGYNKSTGLQIGGTVNAKIKEGMVATGTLTYSTETHAVSLSLTVDEITLLDKTVSKTLFKAAKQIPIVNVYGLGIYVDIGFELGFDFGFKLGFKPTVSFEELSLETFEYKKIAAKLELLGEIFARLTGTPKLGLGIFALDPRILRGGGGLKVPIVGEAKINPRGELNLGYSPTGGVEGDATVGMIMTFGMTGSVKPYAEFSVLDDLWNPTWEGDAIASFEILKPTELFSFSVDFGGDMTKKEPPALPEENQTKAPTPPTASRVLPEEKGTAEEKSGAAAAKNTEGPTSEVPESGEQGPFSMDALKPLLSKLPGVAAVERILKKAGEIWEKIKGFFGRIVKAFKSFFESAVNKLEEILDGFAAKGFGYIPELIRMVVGDTVYPIIEPLIKAVAHSAEQVLQLFETEPPTSVVDFFPWALKLFLKVLNIGIDGITGLVSALRKIWDALVDAARSVVTRMVDEGWIGVQRHGYYIWHPIDDWDFLAATQYKISIPGVFSMKPFKEDGAITNPKSVIAFALYEAFELLGVPPTNMQIHKHTGEPYRDRWVGPDEG